MTVIAPVVCALDQLFPDKEEEVKTTLPPSQNVSALPAVIDGVAGGVGSFNASVTKLETQPIPSV